MNQLSIRRTEDREGGGQLYTLTGTHNTVAYTDRLGVRQILLRPFTKSWVYVGLEVRHGGRITNAWRLIWRVRGSI